MTPSGHVRAPAPVPAVLPQPNYPPSGYKKGDRSRLSHIFSTTCYALACLITEVRVLTRPEMFAKSVGRIMVLPSLASLPNCSR